MQTAEERYEYAWQDYQASKERGTYKSLKSYCQSHHINYEGMRYWKRRNVNHPDISRSIARKQKGSDFITITQGPCEQSTTSGITDVQIACPSGLTVRIGVLPAEVLLQILSMQKGDGPCSL